MLIGEYQNSIDAKGRVIIPAKYREDLGFRLIITKGIENCLYIYSMEEWERFEDKLQQLPIAESRSVVRYFFASAVECEIDKQGRITIPLHLRDHARIEKDLVTIGARNRVEVWSRQEWDIYNEENNENIAEKMAELGI
ncbi:MAG: division/cell wall cluster transcriptional repressor MraZ [Anaerovoracaceae bacterium]|jgi:MraZ protein